MGATYDVFVSYTWVDRKAVEPLVQALRDRGLRIFIDDPEIDDFARITTSIAQGLAQSKTLLAYYSATYPTRRACQWELTAAYLAAQREGDPAQRILVVNPEPTAEHLHPGELRDALFRRTPVPDDRTALAELAQAVANRVAKVRGPLGEVVPLVPPRWLPTQGLGSTRFVDRLAEMWQLHSALHPEATRLTVGRTGPAVAQVRGLGGIGKSLLAEEYALRFGAAYPGGVFWLRAQGSYDQANLRPEELDARRHDELRHLALGLRVPVKDRDPEELVGLLAGAIEERGEPCLWVVDDLPKGLDAHQMRRWLAPHPLASTLFTTRSQAYGALASAIDLDVLGDKDAYELLTARRPPTDEDEAQAARQIVGALGRHALAIDVAGSALRNQQGLLSYVDFLHNLSKPDGDELELVVELSDALPNGHEASITRTLLRSISRLGPEGHDFLRLAASLAPAPIPVLLVTAVFELVDELDEDEARRRAGRALEQAASLSLTTQVQAEDKVAWQIHTLVARAMRSREAPQSRLVGLRDAAIHVLTRVLALTVPTPSRVALGDEVAHARELIRSINTVAEAELLGWVASYDYERGEFRSAEALYRQQWEANRRLLGPNHRDTVISRVNLAEMLRHIGDLSGARTMHEQVLDARRRTLGADHPDTLISANNLAATLRDLDDLNTSRALYEQVWEAQRRILSPDDPNILRTMNNLAQTLHELGELVDAVELQDQVVESCRRVFGPHHPNTLFAMTNLAGMLADLGDTVRAQSLLDQVLNAYHQSFGPDHPRTRSALAKVTGMLQAQGRSSPEMTDEFSEQMSQILSNLAVNLHSPKLEKTMLAHLLQTLEGKDVYASPELLVGAIFRAWDEAAADTSPEESAQSQGGPDLMEYRNCLADGVAALANPAGVTQLVTRLLPAARSQVKEHGYNRQTCARWMTFFGVYALMTGTANTPPTHVKAMAKRGLAWLFSYPNPESGR